MKHIIFSLSGLFLCVNVYSQNAFQETFDLNSDDEFLSVIQTQDGGTLSGGYSTGTPFGGIVVKLNAQGTVQWSRTVGGTRITELVQTSSGLYYAAGENVISSNTNFYLAKLDASGTVLWARTFGKTAEPDQLFSLALTNDGGCILSGSADSTAGSGFLPVGYIVKVDSFGTHQWSRYMSGGNGEIFYSTKPVASGGYLSCGYTGSFGSQVGTEAYVVRWDANGNVLWTSVFGHNNRFDRIYEFVEKPNGGFWVTGNGLYTSTNDNLFMASLDNAGNVVWHKTYSMYQGAWRMMLLADGNLAIAGYNIDLNLGIYNQSYLIKTDTSGNVMWAKQYGDQGVIDDKFWGADVTSDGGFVLAGSTYGTAIQRTSWIVKTDSGGNSGCRDSSLSVLVSNITIASTSGGTVSIPSFAANVNVGQLNVNMSALFFCGGPNSVAANSLVSAVSIYPQPASSSLSLVADEGVFHSYCIYYLEGQLVEGGMISSAKTVVDVSNYSAGMYFIQLIGNGTVFTGKFLKD